MKKTFIYSVTIVLSVILLCSLVFAGGNKFRYKLKPGDKWTAKEVSKVTTDVMGTTSVTRTKRTVVYKVKKGPKKGWATVTAEVTSQTNQMDKQPANKQNTLAGMIFKADIHWSGEVRNFSYSGGDPQIAQYIGPAMKAAMFRFPEFPEEALQIGDEFDVTYKMDMPGMQGMGGMQSVTKLTYTLEEVRKGLAYFSIKSRTALKGSGMEMKDAGKSEAIFDMKAGMWIEHETKSKSQVMAGMGSGGHTLNVSKMTLEKQ
jgi:hypothetical protein